MKYRYIASCVFTRDYPELSLRIQDYLKERFGMEIIRCCAEKYKVRQFEEVTTALLFFKRATLTSTFFLFGSSSCNTMLISTIPTMVVSV